MSFSETKGLWFMAVLMTAAAAALIWILLSARPLRFTILYHDIGGLKQDDPVVLHGIKIGKVEEIKPSGNSEIGVTVRIREDHASTITHGTEFILRKSSFLGLVGDNAIEVSTPSIPGTPFAGGERVQGKEIVKPSLMKQGRVLGQEYWGQLRDETSRLIDAFKASPYHREALAVLDQVKALAEEAEREAREGLQGFQKAHQKEFDELLNRLEKLREEMLHNGDSAGATQVEKEIERVLESRRP